MSDLADLIRSHAPDLSNRQIADRAGLRAGTVDRIMNRVGHPKVETVDKLAHALKIPVEQAREAAGKPRGESAQYVPPAESRLLDDRQRRALDELIRSFVAAKETANEDQGTQSTQGDPTVDDEAGTDRAPMKGADIAWLDDRRAPDVNDMLDRVTEEAHRSDELHAARDLPGMSKGQWLREVQDRDAEAGDPDGPEGGA